MKSKVIDLHGDLFSHFTVKSLEKETDIFNKYHKNNFQEGNVFLSLFNVWIDDESMPSKQRAKQLLTYGAKEVLKNKELNLVRSYQDIMDGKINYIIGLEGLDYLDNADEIYPLYMYGVRLISLTWNHNNNFACSITAENDSGLSSEGIKAVEVMNELGIIIDISHLSDKSAKQIIDLSSQPIIASHSNSRTVQNAKRNLSDDLIKAIANKNGVIGMNAFPPFISEDIDFKNTKGLIKHINYIKDLVGVDYIALGFDFMDYLSGDVTDSLFTDDYQFMSDMKNHSQINNLINALIDEGYTEEEINKITHLNAMRVFKEILK